jgi:hypothetical protein
MRVIVRIKLFTKKIVTGYRMVDDSSSRFKPVCNALFKLVKMSRVYRSMIKI